MDTILPQWIMTRIDSIRDEVVEHKVVDNWFLMPSWFPVTTIVVVYLIFVKYVGPKMMENRKPYNIKYIILAYNLIQTLYNANIVAYVSTYVLKIVTNMSEISFYFDKKQEKPYQSLTQLLSQQAFCEASYLYYISKIIDLLDTIFFVLRKKNSHITFLHVYHHAMMVLTTWAFLRYFKGEQGIFIGLLNSLVHVVMYSYYFLAALGPEVQKYLWWKKYITKFQLTQFALFCIHQLSLIVLSCDMPVALTYYIFFQAVVMCVLFGNFYYQTYTKKHNKQAKATE
ncbi:elongation of very long chain fatty acids protein AAEL008004-like [Diaphorina citri]|uniref:Elongation of very long chain fatty acids protein n=1 Tax=Diaphorina citri TaxID=121845 RepID=A0A3Q0J258_DIACI|nr:elongation of very long chain fatty acids protein AAEL008004-like [Diaphorina citri]